MDVRLGVKNWSKSGFTVKKKCKVLYIYIICVWGVGWGVGDFEMRTCIEFKKEQEESASRGLNIVIIAKPSALSHVRSVFMSK